MTANAMQVDRERCLAAGMNGFVSKPIDPDELWQALLDNLRVREGLGSDDTPQALAAPGAVPSGELLSALSAVEGLEVRQGLRQCNHNAELYVSMLGKFVKSQAQAVQGIRQALTDGDGVTAERLAHTLKGLAASLGAEPLRLRAAELEHSLHAGAGQPLGPLIAQTGAQLDALVAGLQAIAGLAPDAAPPARAALSQTERVQLQQVVLTLRDMLEQDDSEAAAVWQAHAPELHAMLGDAAALEQAINGFDFEQALRLLPHPA